jgi:hypothetical protein
MKPKSLTGMTLSEYAAHRKRLGLTGSTRQAVHAAVKAKRVSLLGDGSIDPEVADAEWLRRTDPSKQRTAHPRGRAPAGDGACKSKRAAGAGAPYDGEYHAGQVEALASITSATEVLSFAVACAHLGCSREVACAIAQLHSSRAVLAVDGVTEDDLSGEGFADPTPEDWRRELGALDLEEADVLCDSVASD